MDFEAEDFEAEDFEAEKIRALDRKRRWRSGRVQDQRPRTNNPKQPHANELRQRPVNTSVIDAAEVTVPLPTPSRSTARTSPVELPPDHGPGESLQVEDLEQDGRREPRRTPHISKRILAGLLLLLLLVAGARVYQHIHCSAYPDTVSAYPDHSLDAVAASAQAIDEEMSTLHDQYKCFGAARVSVARVTSGISKLKSLADASSSRVPGPLVYPIATLDDHVLANQSQIISEMNLFASSTAVLRKTAGSVIHDTGILADHIKACWNESNAKADQHLQRIIHRQYKGREDQEAATQRLSDERRAVNSSIDSIKKMEPDLQSFSAQQSELHQRFASLANRVAGGELRTAADMKREVLEVLLSASPETVNQSLFEDYFRKLNATGPSWCWAFAWSSTHS